MAKSRDNLKTDLRIQNPSWNEFELEVYVTGYYAGIMEYMRLMDQVKQGEYDAILEFQRNKRLKPCN